MEKEITSVQALCSGLLDADCSFFTNFPGSKSQDFFIELGGTQIAMNERIAYERAYGASLAGKRSVVSLKGTGLNATADPYLHSLIAGVHGGMVIILVDDVEVRSSPERQDSRHYMDFFGGLWLEPTTVQMAYDYAYQAPLWSEQFDLPVVIRVTNHFFRMTGGFTRRSEQFTKKTADRMPSKYVSYWKQRFDRLEQKNQRIQTFIQQTYDEMNLEHNDDTGLIVFGNCGEEPKGKGLENADVLSLTMYPIPKNTVRKFLQERKHLYVFEQGDSYGENLIRLCLSDDGVMNITAHTGEIPDLSGTWTVFSTVEKFFLALKDSNPSYVVGDEGQFTDETTKSIDVCLCMGASVGITLGLAEVGVEYPFCIIGDTSFLFSGIQTLTEACARGVNMGIIVLDNHGAQSTGGQPILADIYELPASVTREVVKYDDTSQEQFATHIRKMRETSGISVLYIVT